VVAAGAVVAGDAGVAVAALEKGGDVVPRVRRQAREFRGVIVDNLPDRDAWGGRRRWREQAIRRVDGALRRRADLPIFVASGAPAAEAAPKPPKNGRPFGSRATCEATPVVGLPRIPLNVDVGRFSRERRPSERRCAERRSAKWRRAEGWRTEGRRAEGSGTVGRQRTEG
jgi:hypothetical protein